MVEISKTCIQHQHVYSKYSSHLGHNLLAWVSEIVALLCGFMLNEHDFLLAMIFRYGISSGLTPLVYLFGAGNWRKNN